MIEALWTLQPSKLRALTDALKSGRLAAPYKAAAVKTYCPSELAATVAAELQQLQDAGITPESVGPVVELLRDARARGAVPAEEVELVTSGPEPSGVDTRDTLAVVRELFTSAQESVLVVSYALHAAKGIFQPLADNAAANPKLDVRLFLDAQRDGRETTTASQLAWRFANRLRTEEWPEAPLPAVCYYPKSLESNWQDRASLHAKCIVVDGERVFVTSANFTKAAQTKNIEVGLLVRSRRLAKQLTDHFLGLAAEGQLLPLPGQGSQPNAASVDEDELATLLEVFSSRTHELIRSVHAARLPLPAEDFELERADGRCGIEPEIAWPDLSVAVLSQKQASDQAGLEVLGWRVFVQPADEQQVLNALRERLA